MTNNILAKELLKHFTRKGNKFIFSNGMTLNELALEMWVRLGYKEIDPSVISRVLKGERTFSLKQLEVFTEIIKVNQQEKEKLKRILYEEMAYRYGLKNDFFKFKRNSIVDLINENITEIQTLRSKDMPFLAAGWTDRLIERLESLISLEPDKSIYLKLVKEYGELLDEKMLLGLVTLQPRKLVNVGREVSKKMYETSEILKDKFLYKESLFNLGAIYYIAHQYSKSIAPLEKVLKMDINEVEKGLSLRALALSSAYILNTGVYKEAEKMLLKNLPIYDDNLKLSIYEGLARSSAVIGDIKDANFLLEKAWCQMGFLEKYSQDSVIYRKLQLIRTEFEIFNKLKQRGVSSLEKLGKYALVLAQERGYKRYGNIINIQLNKVLNE